MRKPRALVPGDRIAIISPASSAGVEEVRAGAEELRLLGFLPQHEESLFLGQRYTAGSPAARAEALRRAWADPSVTAIIAARGGYGSVQLLPLLDVADFQGPPKAFIGYSDNTSLMAWLTLRAQVVTFHGPMIEGRFARGPAAYDRDTFERCLMRAEPMGAVTHERLEVVRPGEASGMLLGGTMTQLAGSLGTPFAFDPPDGCILFFDEIGERPYRVDRLFTQLVQAGIIGRASALVFGEMPQCDEPAGAPLIRDVVGDLTGHFAGPVLFGLPSGHTAAATLTLPFGVRARVVAREQPSLVIEESAVE
ncbi:MAG: LD-carboxypeptidase [Vicinamibacterales bacterium]